MLGKRLRKLCGSQSPPVVDPAYSTALPSQTHRCTERENPVGALRRVGVGSQPMPYGSRISQEAKAGGNAPDMLTWERPAGRQGG